MTVPEILQSILATEGGFTHDPHDKGGATNLGITHTTLAWWRKHPITVEELKALTPAEAVEIYNALYVKPHNLDHPELPEEVRPILIDWAINSGPGVPIKALQRLLGVTVDGVIGEETLGGLIGHDPITLNNQLVKARIEMIGRIIARDLTQGRFAHGWLRRAVKFFRG